jgi:hypothetical protein
MTTTYETRQAVLGLKDVVTKRFNHENWLALGLMTGCEQAVQNHDRLLRSLSFGDSDYGGHVISMLLAMVSADGRNLAVIESYITDQFGATAMGGVSVSSTPAPGKKLYFTPSVFQAPSAEPDPNLISVMMPLDAAMNPIWEGIQAVCKHHRFECLRANNVWQASAIIQDIFSLIYRSYIVICDFSGQNPNVFYECGVAHTLGKHVVPLAQHVNDIPFDLKHHRALIYHNNAEGIATMQQGLWDRIKTLSEQRGA